MIRPETIRIAATEAATLRGVVDSVSFVGDRQRVVVSGATARPLAIDAPNALPIRGGDRVGLVADPEAIRLLPEHL